jgi:hypothetical protein
MFEKSNPTMHNLYNLNGSKKLWSPIVNLSLLYKK